MTSLAKCRSRIAERTGRCAQRTLRRRRGRGVVLVLLCLAGWAGALAAQAPPPPANGPVIARAAVAQVGVTLFYDPSYQRLDYPAGDVPRERGVCADVVIRALRTIGVDLQVAVHEDMRSHFAAYPPLWGLRRPDRNIDHRRVANLMTFLTRAGKRLGAGATYEPGDVMAWRLSNGLLHIGVVAEARAPQGHRLAVHNIGSGAQLEDVLFAFDELGHYRW